MRDHFLQRRHVNTYSYFYSEAKPLIFSDKMPKIQNLIPSLSSVIATALSMRYFYSQSVTSPCQFPCPKVYHYPEMYAKWTLAA